MKAEVSHPPGADSIVILACGPNERGETLGVARALQDARIATFVLEPSSGVHELSSRIVAAADWVVTFDPLCDLTPGCFAAGPAARAALLAVSERPWSVASSGIGALVCVANELRMPPADLQRVRVPTLIVGSGFTQLGELHEYSEQDDGLDRGQLEARTRAWFIRHIGRAQAGRYDRVA